MSRIPKNALTTTLAGGALLLGLTVAAANAATAERSQGVDDGPALTSSLEKVGEARLKVMLWTIYDSRLYTANGRYEQGQRPLRLEIEYLIDVTAERLAERTLKEWKDMGRDHPRMESWVARLEALWPDIKSGDVVALELNENQQAAFYRNGELLGLVDDPEFGQQFVDIWLSQDSTRPEMRLSLLGRAS